jgi:hypothetical protein
LSLSALSPDVNIRHSADHPDDVEKSASDVENGLTDPQSTLPSGFEDNSRVPQLSIPRIFWLFFSKFGLFAWGGPVAQIALIKDRLVITDQWITMPRFNRVFAVYQILPGPEAAELCMFFGCLAGGRWEALRQVWASFCPGSCSCWLPAMFTSSLALGTGILMHLSALCNL